jgi:hypothetical protein
VSDDGENDRDGKNGQVGVTEFTSNLISIIDHPLVVKGSTEVILISPPPLAMEFQNKMCENGHTKRIRTAKRTQRYIKAVKDCANSKGLSLCDTEALLLEEAKNHDGGLASLYEDGECNGSAMQS